MAVKVGLVGTGTVGGGCIDILHNHKEDFLRHYGIDIELVRVCSREPEQAEAHGVADIFTEDFNDIINDPEIDIVIELIGGTGSSEPSLVGGVTHTMRLTPATAAGMAFISTDEG